VTLKNPTLKTPISVPDPASYLISLKKAGRPVLAVVSRRVASLYPRLAGALEKGGIRVIAWTDGEENKTYASKRKLEAELIKAGADRGSLVAAAGGGTLLDLAGFTAATLFRGMKWVSVPTTLLAMADASIGGKTGINIKEGKNLVGAFHFPEEVAVWLPFLASLPKKEMTNGLAECLKHGLIADEDHYLEVLNADPGDMKVMESVIRRSQEIKLDIVRKDPFDESGERNILNFGHTIGHGLEKLSGYRRPHGESVIAGMAWETAASLVEGCCSKPAFRQIRNALSEFAGVPRIDGRGMERLWGHLRLDKKNREGEVRYAPLREAGSPALPTPYLAPLRFEVLEESYRLLVEG
jgi:3-dehydroquinate synthetase